MVEHLVRVTCEPLVIDTIELDVASIGNALGQLLGVTSTDVVVAPAMEDEGRRLDALERGTHVGAQEEPEHVAEVAGAGGEALGTSPPPAQARVVGAARGEQIDERPRTHGPRELVEIALHRGGGDREGLVGRSDEACIRAPQHESPNSLGVRRGVQHRRERRLRCGEERGRLAARGFEHRMDAIRPLLHRGELGDRDRVGAAGPEEVAHEQPAERSQPPEDSCCCGLVPEQVDGERRRGNEEEIRSVVARDLVRDVRVAARAYCVSGAAGMSSACHHERSRVTVHVRRRADATC